MIKHIGKDKTDRPHIGKRLRGWQVGSLKRGLVYREIRMEITVDETVYSGRVTISLWQIIQNKLFNRPVPIDLIGIGGLDKVDLFKTTEPPAKSNWNLRGSSYISTASPINDP